MSTQVDGSVENAENNINEGNATAVESISERLQEVTGLAEQLDMALRGAQEDCHISSTHAAQVTPSINKIFDGTASTSEDWNTSQKFSKSVDDETTTNGDDDFVTASECTYTQSRSSSFNTISECEKYSPWWEFDKSDINEDISKEKMVLAVGCPELPLAKSVLKPSITPPPGKIVHEVTETTHIKVHHCHTLGVQSFVLTSETVRDGKADGQFRKEEIKEEVKNLDKKEVIIPVSVEPDLEDDEFMKELREVSKPFESKTAWSKYYNNYVNKITTKGYV